jgi:hypothetical protein
MTGIFVREKEQEMETHPDQGRKVCDHRGRNCRETVTIQGLWADRRSWKRQGTQGQLTP